mgnify:CR=1 FL=1
MATLPPSKPSSGRGFSSWGHSWRRTFQSLGNTDFRWYWIGTLGSFGAIQVQMLARGWLVYDLTKSPLDLGIVSSAWAVPVILFSLISGVVVDRVDRRNLLIVTQSLLALVTLVVAVLIALGLIQVWHLVANALLTGIFFSFNMPGRQALLPQLVGDDELMNAVALNSTGMNLMRIAAPAAAGPLIALTGVAGVWFIIVGFYALGAISLLFIRPQGVVSRPAASPIRDMAEGLNYMRGHAVLLGLMAMALVPILLGMPYQSFLPIFAVDVLNVGSAGLGMLMGMVGVGALVGTLVIASLGDIRRKGLLLFVLAIIFGIALALFALSRSFYLSLFFLLFVGVGNTGYLAVNNALILTTADKQMHGRVMSIYMLSWGLMPLSALPAGWLAEVLVKSPHPSGWLGDMWGIPLVVALGGVLLALAALAFAFLRPELRRL